MDLRQLPALNAVRMFEAAARHESFSRAADELHVTHGAVSHQVRGLEEALGTPLFLREGRRLSLTETGKRYAQQVRAALMLLADATHEARSRERSRQLVVSTLPSFAARWITPRIGSFIEKHPEIDLELHSTNSLIDFARDDIDVAIRFGGGVYPGLHTEPLLEEVFFPVCAPTLNGGRLPGSPAELMEFPLLRSDDKLWSTWFAEAGLPAFAEPRHGVLFHDSSNLLQAAVDGQGIALTRRSLAMSDLLAGRLVRPFDIDGPSPWHYYFVCPPALLDTPRLQAFRAWIYEEVGQFKALCAQVRARP